MASFFFVMAPPGRAPRVAPDEPDSNHDPHELEVETLFRDGPVLALAPMEPVTVNPVLRALAGRAGAELVYRPKILPQHLLKAPKWQFREAIPGLARLRTPRGRRVFDGLQLLARPRDPVADAVKFVEKWKAEINVQFISLNVGCPRSSVVKQGRGGGLLKHPRQVRALVETITSHTSLPVSAKIRTGFTITDHPGAICDVLLAAGVSWIDVNRVPVKHGYKVTRAVRNTYQGIQSALRAVNRCVPVVGNGGIDDVADAREFLDRVGCQGLMVGRAALGDHDLFRRLTRAFPSGLRASAAKDAGRRAARGGFSQPAPPARQVAEVMRACRAHLRAGDPKWTRLGQLKHLVYPYLRATWGTGVPAGCGRGKWQKRRFSWDSLRAFLAAQFPAVPKPRWMEWLPPRPLPP